ncbi:MAG TPA: transcriptional regulator [Saprospirales bacterium]|nr:transcriptional regulator [Saprospirales bacterium]HAY71766.1 transcriptional regulator [Saprospirales bacterium]HCR54830.1 transcriptional regulator [Cytophagales bacterium]
MKKIEVSCPITATLNVIGGKWKSVILWYLREKPLRFSELHKLIPKCSLKIFNSDLKDLEKDGIVKREVFAEVPPKVEYSLTEYGKSLLPVIVILREWGIKRLMDNPALMSDNEELKYFMQVITSTEDLSVLDKFKV